MGRARQLGVGQLQEPKQWKNGCARDDAALLRAALGRAERAQLPHVATGREPALRCRFRALLPTAGGQLLAGGTDRVVRCWDSARPERSYVVCCPPGGAPCRAASPAPTGAADAPPCWSVDMPRYRYAQRNVQGVSVLEETCAMHPELLSTSPGARDRYLHALGWSERAAGLCHHEAVLDLARVDAVPGAGMAEGAAEPLLLSCSRDGVVKAWR
jgi:hypothetical protein